MNRTWALRAVFACGFLLFALLVLRRRITDNISDGDPLLIALFYDGWAFVIVAGLGLYALYRLIVTKPT